MSTYQEIRELLLLGKDKTEDWSVEVNGESITFTYRPLTNGEKAQLDTLSVRGLKTGATMPTMGGKLSGGADVSAQVDIAQVQDNEWTVRFKTIAFGLSINGNAVNEADIKKWTVPNRILFELESRIKRLSGIGDSVDTALNNFPSESRKSELAIVNSDGV